MSANHTLPYPGIVPNVCTEVYQNDRGFVSFNPSRCITNFFHELRLSLHWTWVWDIYIHAVAFAAIRTTKTREHFAGSSYTTQLRVQTMHNTRIVLPVASTIARAEICFRVLKRSPISQPHTLGLRRGYSDGKAVGNTTGLRRSLHPHWRISLLQSLWRALGQTEASSNF